MENAEKSNENINNSKRKQKKAEAYKNYENSFIKCINTIEIGRQALKHDYSKGNTIWKLYFFSQTISVSRSQTFYYVTMFSVFRIGNAAQLQHSIF